MRDRYEILNDLINNICNLYSIQNELNCYTWDCDDPIIYIKRNNIINIFNEYLNGNFNDKLLEDWANTIECRDDIGFDNDYFEEIIYEIANPILFGKNTFEKIKSYISVLSGEPNMN